MRAFTGAILELQEYVKVYHVTGLTWNPDVSLLPPLLFLVSALPKDMASSTLKTLLMHSKLCKHSRQAGCSLSLPRYPRYCHHIYLTCDAHWSCCYVSTGVHCNNCGTLSHTQSSLWSSGIWPLKDMLCIRVNVNMTLLNTRQ